MGREFPPELQAFSELAVSFARAYPALATRLAEPGADPDVERLVEAFAHLTDRVHRLLDAGSSSVSEPFAELVSPELLRAFPSATVLELAPPSEGRMKLASGAEFDSVPVDGTPCRFRAWSDFELVSWILDDARIAWSAADGQSLELSLRTASGRAPSEGVLSSLLPLRLHLTGDTRAALTLLLFLRCHLADIEIELGPQKRVSLGKRALSAWGFLADQALLPPEPFEHPGLRLLREYFILPAKFAFVELAYPTETTLDESVSHLKLRFRFDAPLPMATQVTRENVRINCIPVVNVHERTADPVRPTLERPEHVLRPAGLRLGHGDIYAVRDVRARAAGHSGVVPVAPFSEFEAAAPESLPNAFYVTRITPASSGAGSEVHLSLRAAADADVLPEVDFLSVQIWAGNGALPAALGIGDVCMPTESSPRGIAFRNISAVTPYRPIVRGEELRWRTLALTTLSALPLTDAKALATLLHALNLHPPVDPQAARAHAQRLDAVLDVASAPATTRYVHHDSEAHEGTLVLGNDVQVRLSTAGFDGEGDALVFASVLAQTFAHEASLNSFVRTTVAIAETGRTFRFPAMHGERMLEVEP